MPLTLQQLAPRLTQPAVRALAWLIGAPDLLDEADPRFGAQLVGDAWYAQALAQATPWLLELDRQPQALLDFLAARPTRRLGLHAESLLAFWLRQRPGVELLARNLAVREQKRTLGEFDFIFREPDAGASVHWELAVKFYLQQAEIEGLAGYVGPNEKDTLAAKTQRVFGRQLGLGETQAGRMALAEIGAPAARAQAFIKGWLFYPRGERAALVAGVNPRHARGWWLRAMPGWEGALGPDRRYAILPRLAWLAWPWIAGEGDVLDRAGLAGTVARQIDGGALLVAEMTLEEGAWRECARGFVVPPGWGAAASL
ncbi:MAG: hypothetical protein JWN73_1809 [Betaproteobacteria bacterium]|nr:hypothetical protein [Betaproteobacteria bacterium]